MGQLLEHCTDFPQCHSLSMQSFSFAHSHQALLMRQDANIEVLFIDDNIGKKSLVITTVNDIQIIK